MADDKIKTIKDILLLMQENTSDVESVALINSQDGLIISSTCKSNEEEEKISAIISSINADIQNKIFSFKKSRLKQFFLETDDFFLVVYIVNESILLNIFANKNACLGLILLNIKCLIKQINELL